MNEGPTSNNQAVRWIVAALAAALVLCGLVVACGATAATAYLLGRAQGARSAEIELLPGQVLPPSAPLPQRINGALIQQVVPDSPAAQADLRPGDIITAVDGRPITPQRGLAALIQSYRPGDRVTITCLRLSDPDRPEFEVTVTLAEHPERPGAAFLGVSTTELFMRP